MNKKPPNLLLSLLDVGWGLNEAVLTGAVQNMTCPPPLFFVRKTINTGPVPLDGFVLLSAAFGTPSRVFSVDPPQKPGLIGGRKSK